MLSAKRRESDGETFGRRKNVLCLIIRRILIKWRIPFFFRSFEANYQKIYQPYGGSGVPTDGWSRLNVLVMIDPVIKSLDSANF